MKHLQKIKNCIILLGTIVVIIMSVYIYRLRDILEQENKDKTILENRMQLSNEVIDTLQWNIDYSEKRIEELQKKLDEKLSYTVNYQRYNTEFCHIENTVAENIPVPQVRMEDKELQAKINQTLYAGFFEWLPIYFSYCNDEELFVGLSTEKYLSIVIHYVKYDKKIDNFYMNNTVNMQTGEWVALDDIVEVDEELVSLLLTEGIPKVDYSIMSGEYDVDLSADILARYDSEYELECIWQSLQECSQEYTVDENSLTKEWYTKGSFWLTEDRLYLRNVLFLGSEIYVEYEDIAHKIKDKSLLK